MKILLAEDERISRRMLETILTEWGYEVVAACDGAAAWQILQRPDSPRLALLDWVMPGMDGIEVCQRVRAAATLQTPYLILLTVKGRREDIVAGLRAGADDFIAKPFDPEELQARLQTGRRIVDLQTGLASRVKELEDAISHVKQLRGLLPMCAYCKRIRDSQDYWHQVESYVQAHSEAEFTHGICPHCWKAVVEPEFQRLGVRVGD
jgi:DNA-binding response OmpR family regulator